MPRILIADDHAVVRKGLAALITQKPGWVIVGEASTGTDATEMVREFKPDVAIFDYSLPPTTGADIIPACLAAVPDLQVLIFTMHEDDAVILRSIRAGARGLLTKGQDGQLLDEALDALGRGEPFLRGRVGEIALMGLSQQAAQAEEPLTPRELEVMTQLAKGFSGKEAALILGISPKTVEIHRSSVMRKLKLRNLVEMVHYAVRNGIIEL